MSLSTDDWFVTEILVHEAALTQFLARRWREAAEIADLRQEIYIRVYEAARTNVPRQARAFLFATARNLMSDQIRRQRVVSIETVADFERLNVFMDEAGPEQRESSRQELQRLAAALERLPPRCREVIWLRRVKGLSQKEAAATLGICEGTIEKQVAKGIRLLADILSSDVAERGEAGSASARSEDLEPSRSRRD